MRGEHNPQPRTSPPFPCHHQSSSRGTQDLPQPVRGQSQLGPALFSSTLSTEHVAGSFAAGTPEPYLPATGPRTSLSQPPAPSLLFPGIFQTPSLTGTFSSRPSVFRHNQNHSHNDIQGLPDSSEGKESACNAGDTRDEGLVPGSGRSPGVGNGNPFPYSCLENPHGQRGLVGYAAHGVAISRTQLSD